MILYLSVVSANVSELQKVVHEKDNHIARLYCKLRDKEESTGTMEQSEQDNNKPSIDTSQLVVHDNVEFTLGKL